MNQQNFKTKVLVIGSGSAGCSAAIYTARSALQPIVVSGQQKGGQLTITTDVENYPGFAKSIQGPYLMDEMIRQSERAGAKIVNDIISDIDLDQYPFKASGVSGNSYIADSVIIATGAQARWLGLESEKKFMGFGVSGCATCDGFFYKNKDVLVVGGGNTAVEEALYLTKHASQVFLVHRRNTLRAEKILQNRLFDNRKVKVIWDSILMEILGSNNPLSVNGVIVKNLKTASLSSLNIDGVFIAIGHQPNTKLFKDKINMDMHGYIITLPDNTATSKEGIFAAGDVQDKVYRQAITAAGTGCMAAIDTLNFLESKI